jgi:hypothetical protein
MGKGAIRRMDVFIRAIPSTVLDAAEGYGQLREFLSYSMG